MRTLCVAALAALVACSDAPPPAPGDARPPGPLASHAARVSAAHALPADLLLAIGAVEGGLLLPRFREVDPDDEVPVAGIVELRRGAFDSLAAAAALAGRPEGDLRADTDLGTEAAAALLASMAPASRPAELASWGEALGELSGHAEAFQRRDYAARVLRVLRAGGSFAARDGEVVRLPPHPEVPVALTLSPPRPRALGVPESTLVTEWVETPKSGPNGPCTNKWNDDFDQKLYVAIHDTEGGWDASLATLQNDGCKSVQYMIDKDGSRVAQFLPEKITAFHLGNYHYNQRTIGIEHVGKASETYARTLYDTSVALVLDITARWKIPIDRQHIWGHYQVPDGGQIASDAPVCALGLSACEKSPDHGGAGNHRDPGLNWQWCQYMERLGGSCECNDAWENWNCTTDLTQAWRCHGGQLEKQECTAGCVVQPVGTPDQCNVAGPPATCAERASAQGWGGWACDSGDGACGGEGEPSSDCARCCEAGAAGGAGASGSSGQSGAAGQAGAGAAGPGGEAGAGVGGSSEAGSAGTSASGAAGQAGGGGAAGLGGAGAAGLGGAGAAGTLSGSSGQSGGKPEPIRIDLGDSTSDGGCTLGGGAAGAAGARSLTAAGIALALLAARRRRRSLP